ncbi:MAG: haloacid dehalogenase type II [Paracoccaceae bacterium]
MARAVIFDAYGTLLDVDAAARALAETEPALAEAWPALSRDWRAKQLEYTWLRAAAGRHADFRAVTDDALAWALEGAALDAGLHGPLMTLYEALPAFPEVACTLANLTSRGIATGVLSNGTPGMLRSAIEAAGIGEHLGHVLSVEDARVFKPAGAVYDLVGAATGLPPGDVLFVSANGWDACAGAGYGFETAWVNRRGAPMDRLWGRPDHVVPDLTHVTGLV